MNVNIVKYCYLNLGAIHAKGLYNLEIISWTIPQRIIN